MKPAERKDRPRGSHSSLLGRTKRCDQLIGFFWKANGHGSRRIVRNATAIFFWLMKEHVQFAGMGGFFIVANPAIEGQMS